VDTKDYRAKWGITQEELAIISSIPRERIAKWEQGKGNPKAEDTTKLIELDKIFDKICRKSSPDYKTKSEQVPDEKPSGLTEFQRELLNNLKGPNLAQFWAFGRKIKNPSCEGFQKFLNQIG
jgi:transcriptional regulator with XRE-family HTH domain